MFYLAEKASLIFKGWFSGVMNIANVWLFASLAFVVAFVVQVLIYIFCSTSRFNSAGSECRRFLKKHSEVSDKTAKLFHKKCIAYLNLDTRSCWTKFRGEPCEENKNALRFAFLKDGTKNVSLGVFHTVSVLILFITSISAVFSEGGVEKGFFFLISAVMFIVLELVLQVYKMTIIKNARRNTTLFLSLPDSCSFKPKREVLSSEAVFAKAQKVERENFDKKLDSIDIIRKEEKPSQSDYVEKIVGQVYEMIKGKHSIRAYQNVADSIFATTQKKYLLPKNQLLLQNAWDMLNVRINQISCRQH